MNSVGDGLAIFRGHCTPEGQYFSFISPPYDDETLDARDPEESSLDWGHSNPEIRTHSRWNGEISTSRLYSRCSKRIFFFFHFRSCFLFSTYFYERKFAERFSIGESSSGNHSLGTIVRATANTRARAARGLYLLCIVVSEWERGKIRVSEGVAVRLRSRWFGTVRIVATSMAGVIRTTGGLFRFFGF